MRKPLVAGNWKMNASSAEAHSLVTQLVDGFASPEVEVLVCPPAVYIQQVEALCEGSPFQVGAQNCSEHTAGAYTGEVSAPMLADVGCSHVIIGHSERRSLYNETDQKAAAKFEQAKEVGLIPILCVGETLEERKAGKALTLIAQQVEAVFERLGPNAFRKAVIAYEPVWAIGTGETASPEQAEEVHQAIRQQVAEKDAEAAEKLQILYGGSVNAGNAATLFSMPNIDGGLVGGASLKANDFLTICQAASH